MQLDFATIASAFSTILIIATLIGFAIKAGERREAMSQMKRDIDGIREKITEYDVSSREDGKLLAGIHATLTALVNSVDDMRRAFQQHVGRGD